MKISKVNHARTVSEGTKPGIMYRNPSKNQDSRLSIVEHVNSVNESAKRLYKLFNKKQACGKDKDLRDFEKNFTKEFDKAIINIVKQSSKEQSSEKVNAAEAKSALSRIEIDMSSVKNADIVIDRILNARLRKSLCGSIIIDGNRVSVFDAIKSLAKSICIGTRLIEADIETVIAAVSEDYYKTSRLSKIVESIEKKDVKVQVYNTGKSSILKLSSSVNPKKRYISEFLDEYSAASTEEQDKMLINMRRLIILFTRGEEAYKKACESNIAKWSWMSIKAAEDSFFAENIDKKFSEMENIEKKISELEKSCANEKNPEKKSNTKKNIASQINIKKNIASQIKKLIEEKITGQYIKTKNINISDNDRRWIAYFEDETSKLYARPKNLVLYKLRLAYLENYLWDCWISYIASKYVDMGKAVYNFAMPDLSCATKKEDIVFGIPDDKYKNGITGFDYELIKARESLMRGMEIYVSYASNCFANSTFPVDYRAKEPDNFKNDNSDVLFYNEKDFSNLFEDSNKKLFRYFGGISLWRESEALKQDRVKLAMAFKECISAIRNMCYHYAPGSEKLTDGSRAIITDLFEEEMKRLGNIYRQKYYSNNTLRFYPEEKITALMDRLYAKRAKRVAQVPAFNNIVKRKSIAEFLNRFANKDALNKFANNCDVIEKYRSSMFFILKEIYYYGFIQCENLEERFSKALENAKQKAENPEAYNNFCGRIKELKASSQHITFGEICQYIMTDYNMQNQAEKIIKSHNEEEKSKDKGNKKKYQHFRMLLYKTISIAFENYLNEAGYAAFLKIPRYSEDICAKDTFCSGWKAHTFDYLIDSKDDAALSWYAASHFLTPKQLNQLIGTFRNYSQYVSDIVRRAESVGISRQDALKGIEYCDNVLGSLEFVAMFAGTISNNIEDYFENKDQYAAYVGKYVKIADKKVIVDEASLMEFCSKTVKINKNECQKIGIYSDETNPILNRNIVLASIYGFDSIISEALSSKKVNEKDIADMYELKKKLDDVFKTGSCKTKEEQENLVAFQQLKNKVELVDISIYSDIINDLYSHLIGWAYLRERDLMYFQLGFYYCKLFHADTVDKDSHLRKIDGANVSITDGAVLYQIAAMYTYDLPVYDRKGNPGKASAVGSSIKRFVNDYCKEDIHNDPYTYNNGLCFFEDMRDHDSFSDLRNDIAHMKYFSICKKSIVSLYSDIYNGFFRYDRKLQNSVAFIMKNTLMDYFVEWLVSFRKMEKTRPEAKNKFTGARFAIFRTDLKSDVFVYKNKAAKKVGANKEFARTTNATKKFQDNAKKAEAKEEPWKLEVRSDDFLKRLAEILSYPRNTTV